MTMSVTTFRQQKVLRAVLSISIRQMPFRRHSFGSSLLLEHDVHGNGYYLINQPGKCACFGSFTVKNNVPPPIDMEQFNYSLDDKNIAKYPASPRGSSRLLRVHSSGEITHFENFSTCFPQIFEEEDSHLVLNESPVLCARVFIRTCRMTTNPDPFEMMILDLGQLRDEKASEKGGLSEFTAMVRRTDVREGDMFVDDKTNGSTAKFLVKHVIGIWFEDPSTIGNGTECIIEMTSESKLTSVDETLETIGTVPIPPYLDRAVEPGDKQAYNNIYATPSSKPASGGSVAAPTAGLHFTKAVLDDIGADRISYLSLHVGAGTFKPVVVSDARDHAMHAESFAVNAAELRRIVRALDSGKRLIAVGTTSTRTLESLYWCGVKKLLELQEDEDNLTIDQEEWFHLQNNPNFHTIKENYSVAEILKNLVRSKTESEVLLGRTRLMIAPNGYEMKVVHHLVTNFHAPDSTLLLLISNFLGSGGRVKFLYSEAQSRGYRFLSYGDVCMFSRPSM